MDGPDQEVLDQQPNTPRVGASREDKPAGRTLCSCGRRTIPQRHPRGTHEMHHLGRRAGTTERNTPMGCAEHTPLFGPWSLRPSAKDFTGQPQFKMHPSWCEDAELASST